jgi:DNA-binding transcriptional LysR family regulator
MNLNHLYYFRVLAKTQHYTQAANILNITQPSLSHAIAQLEKDLDCYLFEKQGRNIRLTRYGQIFYEYVDQGLKQIELGQKRIEEITSPNQGWIHLAFIYTLGYSFVPNMIKDFHSIRKNAQIKFTLKQGNTTELLDGLENEKYDIALCSYQESRNNIQFTPITTEELVVVISKNHPLAIRKEIDLKELQNEYFIYYSKESGLRPMIDDLFESQEIKPNILFEVEEDSAVLGLVDINYGVAVVPDIPMIEHFNLKKLKITNPHKKRYIYLATVKNRYLPPAVHSFCNFLTTNSCVSEE